MTRAFPLLQVFAALFLTVAFHTAGAAPVLGKDYVLINPPQPTTDPDSIEVLEAFSYKCPHCHELEPKLSAWIKTLPADVDLRRLPVTFNRPDWTNLAKTYYTLEAMIELEKLHGKVFEAIHTESVDLSKPDVMSYWISQQGIDKKKFSDLYSSFGVQTKVSRVPLLTRNYGIDGVPSIIVDGKYRVISRGSYDDMLRTAGEVIAMARSQRPKKAADVTTNTSAATPETTPAKKAAAKN